ncbi:MAG: hypothetical protein IKT90_05275 [Clostridia bacterium]|nr:hypothetical protein [Clostridia bacterium]
MRRTELVKHFLQDKNARRRGLGIEIALLVLLAAVALSALLVSSAMLERNGLKDREAETLERLALDQIAEKYLADHGNLPDESTGYRITAGAGNNFAVYTTDGELKLDVTVSNAGKVTGWTYHNLGIGG